MYQLCPPGLNTEHFNNVKVLDVAKTSNLNLFMHTTKTGDFGAAEKDFLESLAKKTTDKSKINL